MGFFFKGLVALPREQSREDAYLLLPRSVAFDWLGEAT